MEKKLRGFARMDQELHREIASRGGKAAHVAGTAHRFTPKEGRDAGRKGGKSVSADRTHMQAIGRLGGQATASKRPGEAAQERENSPDESVERNDV